MEWQIGKKPITKSYVYLVNEVVEEKLKVMKDAQEVAVAMGKDNVVRHGAVLQCHAMIQKKALEKGMISGEKQSIFEDCCIEGWLTHVCLRNKAVYHGF